jgi:hypothetical protein
VDDYEEHGRGGGSQGRRTHRQSQRRGMVGLGVQSGDALSDIASSEDESVTERAVRIRDRVQLYILEVFQYILLDVWPRELLALYSAEEAPFTLEDYQERAMQLWLAYVSLLEDYCGSLTSLDDQPALPGYGTQDNNQERCRKSALSEGNNIRSASPRSRSDSAAIEDSGDFPHKKQDRRALGWAIRRLQCTLASLLGLFLFCVRDVSDGRPLLPCILLKWIRSGRLCFLNCAEALPPFFKKLLRDRRQSFSRKYKLPVRASTLGLSSHPSRSVSSGDGLLDSLDEEHLNPCNSVEELLPGSFLTLEALLPKEIPTGKQLDAFLMNFEDALAGAYGVPRFPSVLSHTHAAHLLDLLIPTGQLPPSIKTIVLMLYGRLPVPGSVRAKFDKYRQPPHMQLIAIIGITLRALYTTSCSCQQCIRCKLPPFASLVATWRATGLLDPHPTNFHHHKNSSPTLTSDESILPWIKENVIQTTCISLATQHARIEQLLDSLQLSFSQNENYFCMQAAFHSNESARVQADRQPEVDGHIATLDARSIISKLSLFQYSTRDRTHPWHPAFQIILLLLNHLCGGGYSPSILAAIMHAVEQKLCQ